MNPPKAVIFDLGKVLLDFDYKIAAARLHPRCQISCENLQALIDQSPLLYRYESNLLSTEQFFAEIKNAAGFCGELAEFAELFGDIFTPIDPMVRLHVELKHAGVPTYIFSNTNHLAVDHIRRRYAFFNAFDGYILSCEHGALKPDPKIYEVVESVACARGSDLLYIDDRLENIAAGVARGWISILHESPEKTRRRVAETSLLPLEPIS